jgi:hypothetical protein
MTQGVECLLKKKVFLKHISMLVKFSNIHTAHLSSLMNTQILGMFPKLG